MISRKTLAFVLVVLATVLAAPDVGAREHGNPAPCGTWMINVDFDFIVDPEHPDETVPFDLAYLQDFDADGRTTVLLPFGEGHPNAGDTRVGCMGEWKRRGRRGHVYDLTMRCLYNQDGQGPYGEIRGILKMKGPDKLSVKFSYVDHNADGSVNYFQGWGLMRGDRIKVDPLP